eukprot:COSAG02_NODE_696_length_18385_cov_48.260855_15_plen_102_part_00
MRLLSASWSAICVRGHVAVPKVSCSDFSAYCVFAASATELRMSIAVSLAPAAASCGESYVTRPNPFGPVLAIGAAAVVEHSTNKYQISYTKLITSSSQSSL